VIPVAFVSDVDVFVSPVPDTAGTFHSPESRALSITSATSK
jgi:hypothetical protein